MSLANFREIGRKIVCIGRNYSEHAKELGNPIPKKPLFFVKTTNSYVAEGSPIITPPGCKDLQQEVELGVIISKVAKNVKKEEAMDFIGGYTVALDMTARDFQDDAKKAGTPWFLAKSFDTSCPVAGFIEKNRLDPMNCEIFSRINDIDKQRSNTNSMIFDIPTMIAYITKFVTLQPGDLLLTGTPAGVTQLNPGDKIEFGITDVVKATFFVK